MYFILVYFPHSVNLVTSNILLYVFFLLFVFFYHWHQLGGDFAVSGVSLAPFLFAELLSFYIFGSHLALCLSHISPFGLLALQGAP